MADKSIKTNLLSYFPQEKISLSIHDILLRLPEAVPTRTLRRWLYEEVEKGNLVRFGQKRGTRYQLNQSTKPVRFAFLNTLPEEKQSSVLKQLRDLWTHSSTALEGNTLTLGDTHFVLEEGLTISGKPIKDHQEIIGHASAIEILYQLLDKKLTPEDCFSLHKAVQTEIIYDIDKPNGAWKVRPNGTYTVTAEEKPVYLEYALPQHVAQLMEEVIDYINSEAAAKIKLKEAHICYAKCHAAIVHIHPFWDGNGRIARLLSNIPLLKSGLPPIVISKEKRREYIQILADYELSVGQLNNKTGVWPNPKLLTDFESFCQQCFKETISILDVSKNQ